MTPFLAFSVAMKPVGKARHRTTIGKDGKPHSYSDARTVAAEAEVRAAFRAAYPRMKPHDGPVELSVIATFAVPASWPKWKRLAGTAGLWPHTSKPDGDNVAKTVMDALNGHAYTDDSQVFDLAVRREYGPDARVLVTMRLYDSPTREDLA